MATSRAFARTVYSAIAVLLLLASPDVSFAAAQASCDAPPPHIVVAGSVNVDMLYDGPCPIARPTSELLYS